jgi:lipopolysaccharide heptosyltransferase I
MHASDSFALPTFSRILIFRLSAIGDCVHGLPVACALRDHDPTLEIGWVVEGRTAEILRGHRAIDKVICIPRGWYKSWATMSEARQAVREFAPDITIDLQGLTKSAALAACSGAKTRLGFSGQEGRELSSWFNNLRMAASATHVVDKNLELLTMLGVVPQAARFDLPVDAASTAKIRDWTLEQRLSNSYAVLNPGAGWASKRWPVERFAAVAAGLQDRFGLRSVVTWAPGEERNWADQIVSQAGGAAVLAPPTTLVELTALCREAKLFVSGDTGPLHLAAAVDTPCVALFGASDAQRNGPYGHQHRALQPVQLVGSSRMRRNADNTAVSAITVKAVLSAAGEILRGMPREQSQRHVA